MADNPRSTTPAWQDPHLKDRGDYTEQDIQNIRGKGGILPDFTLDEAEGPTCSRGSPRPSRRPSRGRA